MYLCEGDPIRSSCYLHVHVAACLANTIFPHVIKCMYIHVHVHVFIVIFDEQLSMVIATTVAYVNM